MPHWRGPRRAVTGARPTALESLSRYAGRSITGRGYHEYSESTSEYSDSPAHRSRRVLQSHHNPQFNSFRAELRRASPLLGRPALELFLPVPRSRTDRANLFVCLPLLAWGAVLQRRGHLTGQQAAPAKVPLDAPDGALEHGADLARLQVPEPLPAELAALLVPGAIESDQVQVRVGGAPSPEAPPRRLRRPSPAARVSGRAADRTRSSARP